MKLFHETTIDLPFPEEVVSPDLPGLRICVISDLHYARWMKDEKLSSIAKKMKEVSPDYIFIPGDLVDNNEEIAEPSSEKRLLDFLADLGHLAPTLISPGNHDAYKSPKKDEGILENPGVVAKVNQLSGVFYLSDAAYEDDQIYVFGYNQKPRYYDSGIKNARFTRPIDENVDLMLADLKSLPKIKVLHPEQTHLEPERNPLVNLPRNKLKFALVHSPVRLDHPEVRKLFAEFDYFVSGHMHDGVIPPLIFELWRGERGFIAPGKRFFPKNARVTKKTLEQKKIIAGAATDFSKQKARGLNALFPIYFTTLNFSPSSKIRIRRRYRRQKSKK